MLGDGLPLFAINPEAHLHIPPRWMSFEEVAAKKEARALGGGGVLKAETIVKKLAQLCQDGGCYHSSWASALYPSSCASQRPSASLS